MENEELETKGVGESPLSKSSPKEPVEEQPARPQEVSSWSDSGGQEKSPGGGTVLRWPAKRGQLCLLTWFPKEVRQMRLGWISICLSILLASVG